MALWVIPPPHGFSHASFSSNKKTRFPARASLAAAKDPAGPAPITAMTSRAMEVMRCRLILPDCRRSMYRQQRGRVGSAWRIFQATWRKRKSVQDDCICEPTNSLPSNGLCRLAGALGCSAEVGPGNHPGAGEEMDRSL